MEYDIEQLKAEMRVRVEAILADPEVDENVFRLIINAGVEVASRHLIKKMIADFWKPTERAFGGGGILDRRKQENFPEKIPRSLTSISRFM